MHGKDTQRIQFSLCSRKKPTNFGSWRTVGEPFVDGTAQVCSPIHTYALLVCEWFVNHLARSCIRGYRWRMHIIFWSVSHTQNIHISATCNSLCTLLFASFKNFYIFTGIRTQDFQYGKEPVSDVQLIDSKLINRLCIQSII